MELFKRFYALVLLLFMAITVFPAEDETEPRVVMRNTGTRPMVGSTWVLTLYVDHQEPKEVDVRAPNFTGALFLDQVLKVPRYLNAGTGQFLSSRPIPQQQETVQPAYEAWTAMEYRFVLNSPGIINFNAFTVITPLGRVRTAPFSISVQRPQGSYGIPHFRLEWDTVPARLAVGESAVFGLYAGTWKETAILPETEIFLPPVPPGYILESLTLSEQEQAAGMILKLRLIPLETEPFVLERRQFTQNGAIFEIPPLRIPVNQIPGEAAASPNQAEETVSGETLYAPPFPSLSVVINSLSVQFKKHQAEETETVYNTIRSLWERRCYADTLAALRKNEREHSEGILFAALRREAEQTLGLFGTNDEKRGKALFPWPWGNKSQSAVLRETSVRRIPDTAGAEIAFFREGQPVLLPSGLSDGVSAADDSSVWIKVIANDTSKAEGWVLKEYIIAY